MSSLSSQTRRKNARKPSLKSSRETGRARETQESETGRVLEKDDQSLDEDAPALLMEEEENIAEPVEDAHDHRKPRNAEDAIEWIEGEGKEDGAD